MRVTPNVYTLGAIPRLRVTFTDLDGELADPTSIAFKIVEPDDDATVTEYTFGSDVELVRASLGVFYVDWETRVAGTHCYRFAGSGAVRAVAEKQFEVDAGCFE